MPQKACRTCLKLFDNGSQLTCIESNQQSHRNDLKHKLEACVPEIVFNRVANALICFNCVDTLNLAYKFKIKCIETERQLSQYMSAKTIDCVDLVSFVKDVSNGNISDDDVIITDVDDTHIPNCLLPNNSIKCSVCHKSFDTIEQIKEHINSHADEVLKCTECQFQSKSKNALSDHMKTHKSRDATLKCGYCDFTTNDRNAHVEHCSGHTGIKYYSCNLCPFKANRSYSVRRHLKKHGTGNKLLKCNVCPFTATDDETLHKHSREHEVAKPFSCKHCSYTAVNRSNLRKHMRRNHKEKLSEHTSKNDDPFHISVSDIENILDGNNLKEIVNEKDADDDLNSFIVTVDEIEKMIQENSSSRQSKIFRCSKCRLPFKFKFLLNKHMTKHHSSNDNKSLKKCGECGFGATNKSTFEVHMRMHTGGKVYSCDKCEFRTIYSSNINKHNRVHMGQKALKCMTCNYKTFKKDSMDKHMLTHVEPEIDPVMKCGDCPFETTSTSAMEEHTEMHIIGNEFIDNSIHEFLPHTFHDDLL